MKKLRYVILVLAFLLSLPLALWAGYGLGPYMAGSVETNGYAKGVYVSGSYAYVTEYCAGLEVIDVSDPTNPQIVGSVDTDGCALGVYVSGNYVYVANGKSLCGRAGLKVIDVSDPTNPQIVGSVDTDNALGVYVSGNYAYVADYEAGLKVIDVSDPTNPHIVGSVDTDNALGVYVSGNYAYVADYGAGLKIIDISDPTSPQIVGNVYTDGYALGVYVSGNYAYVADYRAGLKVIDISDPTSPQIVGSVDTDGSAKGVYVSGSYAYVADYGAGLKVIDISDPTNPQIVGSVDTDGYASDVYVSGNYAYVADREAGLKVIDISNPTSPQIVGSVDTDWAVGVYVSRNYAYVADDGAGLKIIDISDPTSPQIVGSVYTDYASDVYVSGNYAYVADEWDGLKVIDVSDPTHPQIVGSVDTDYASDVYVSGNYAYVAEESVWYGGSGLKVIDVSDPTSPQIVGSVDAYGISVYVSGSYAYVANEDFGAGLEVIDVSDPTHPQIVGSVDTDAACGVYISGNYAYVADGGAGLKIIDIRPEIEQHVLTVSVDPEEGGAVTAEGINCPGDCSEDYGEGTEVTLTATPVEGFVFAGWGGDCAACEGPTCTIVMDGDKTCTAEFEPANNPPNAPTVISPEDGATNVPYESVEFTWDASDPDGDALTYNFYFGAAEGDVCTPILKAEGLLGPSYGIEDLQPSTTYCWKVEACDESTCTAGPVWHFTTEAAPVYYGLTVSVDPEEGGTVTAEGINCPGDCSEDYGEGTEVTLTATPAEGYVFSGWSGDCATCDGPTCTITMDADKACTAEFEPANNPPNAPTVLSPEDSATNVPYDYVVFTWEATDPDGDSLTYNFYFGAAEGDVCTPTLKAEGLPGPSYAIENLQPSTTYCWKVEACDESSCTAGPVWYFTTEAAPVYYGLTISVDPEEGGAVTAEGINCPGDCSEDYGEGTEVTLTAIPVEGYVFAGWGGDCAACDGPTCTITMDSDKTCTAEFQEVQAEMPDLVVSKLVTPRYWRQGSRGRVSLIIENRGEVDVTEPFVVRIYANMSVYELGEQVVDGLAAGEKKLLRFKFEVPGDLCYPTNQHTLHAVVDADDNVVESDELNNEVTKDIVIRGCP